MDKLMIGIEIERKLVEYMGWVHVHNDDLRDDDSVVWMFYRDKKILKGRPYRRNGAKYDHAFDEWLPTQNFTDAYEVEDRIKAQGLKQLYVEKLCKIAGASAAFTSTSLFALIHATPEMRAKAALETFEANTNISGKPKGQRVVLKSFNGTKSAPKGTNSSEDYWSLIGSFGTIVRGQRRPGKVCIVFDEDIQERGLECHNNIPNSLFILVSDLEMIVDEPT